MIIGIDLGTTNSAAAYTDDEGRSRLVTMPGGGFSFPSIYAVDDEGRELVGFDARRQWQLNPNNTVYGAKRLIGRQYDADFIEEIARFFTYSLIRSEHDTVEVELAGKRRTLTDISARILGAVHEMAETNLERRIDQAVVTVPAYFDDRQRQSVKDAGAAVGLEVVRVINEPTAAALAYGYGRELSERVVVFDLGGGTFDVSIIEIRDNVFEVVATDGDLFLGGINFDQALLEFIINEFQQEHGIDLSQDGTTIQRLREMSEQVKIDLSSRTEATFSVPFVAFNDAGEPLDVERVITREEFQSLVQDLVDRTIEVCAGVIEDAGLRPEEVDEILLVGGQSRMPAVADKVSEYFGKPPSKGVHPDEAVALGAAIFASALEAESAGGDQAVTLLDVISLAIGIERADGEMFEIFPKNTPTPNRKDLIFTTSRDNQRELVMKIYQGEDRIAANNQHLGEHNFDGIKPGHAGSVRVQTRFDLSVDGLLTLHARDVDTKKAVRHSLKVPGLDRIAADDPEPDDWAAESGNP
ncbi:MAG TPA: 2-alkenal reductase [Myxococcales bacterium]|nr:2-alkenal reductase [Myxococcales bacterium]